MSDVKDNHTTVPFRYRAVMTWEEQVPKDGNPRGPIQSHQMTLHGRVHPEPYSFDAASELVDRKLQPLVDLGWFKVEVEVKAYSA